jgi:hypothetical protein
LPTSYQQITFFLLFSIKNKKRLDKADSPCYNTNITIKREKNMNKPFKTGDMVQMGSRKENTALVLGKGPDGGWLALPTMSRTGTPIIIFQSSIMKVVS